MPAVCVCVYNQKAEKETKSNQWPNFIYPELKAKPDPQSELLLRDFQVNTQDWLSRH